MNEYIQEKIKELLRLLDVRIVDTSANYRKMEEMYSEDLKNALFEAYNRGVEDALKCVVNGRSMVGTDAYDADYSWNDCRQQTIDNIKKLTPSKEDK